MKPDFLIIGAMKAGTTSLAFQLDAHPDIAMSHPKEPGFFAIDEAWQKGWSWYESCFSHSPDKRLRGDASTAYAKSPLYADAPARIAAHCPDVKLIYLVRNPLQRAISQYRHRWFGRYIPQDCTFGAYLQLDETAIEFSRYYYQLEKYLEYFQSEQIKIIVSEDYYDAPTAVTSEIYDFLGIDNHWMPDDFEVKNSSESKVRKAPWLVKLRSSKLIPSGLKQMIPQSLREQVRNFQGVSTPPPVKLSQHLSQLLPSLVPEVEKLSEYVNRDLMNFWQLDKLAHGGLQRAN